MNSNVEQAPRGALQEDPLDDVRLERDPLGEVAVPAARLYGPQTQRAVENFPLSGTSIATIPELIRALAQVKKAAALSNMQVGELAPEIGNAIIAACDEVAAGQWDAEFAVDIVQGGAGTSTNMNANEVIANRALEIAGFQRGDYARINPNDHVNRSQSTNDAYATAVRLAAYAANLRLTESLTSLSAAMAEKAIEFAGIAKLGRTQMQDAVPMTLGQEFGSFAATIANDVRRGREAAQPFLEVNLGGTAIGTGAGASLAYREAVVGKLGEVTGLPITRAENLIEATWDMSAFLSYSGYLKRVAAKLSKISNDLRLLSSGPCGGFGEIALPERQPGSSIMPGKVNPVIPEAMNAVAFRVFGNDTSITFAAEAGQLQLNAFEPVIIAAINESVNLLCNAMEMLKERCIRDLRANATNCQRHMESGTALATYLVPHIGYARAAEVAKLALTDYTLREAAEKLEPSVLPVLDAMLRQKDW